ncbi:MAG: hypothetical protein PHQ65_01310 [Bacteroidales bacterium]|jgi:tellurite resistance protein|nr:hypothetical protein [Bacteroidales bacterium]MDD3663879.1 hypothetical protein [Bacteroidales bacterium]
MDYQEFFIETGRLFYAIGMADGAIQPDERSKMLGIIRENLKELESSSDAFGTANAYYTEFEIERLIDFNVSSKEAFRSFLDFVAENEQEIDMNLRKLIVQMAENVAESWNGIEKGEADLIDLLRRKLKIV